MACIEAGAGARRSAAAAALARRRALSARHQSDHVPALDGLRGVAAAIVVVAHCVIAFDWSPPVRHALFASPLALVLNSEGAVMLFFVLSGTVLAGSLERSVGLGGVLQFWVKRIFRIHPPYLFGLYFAWTASFFYVVMPVESGLSPWLAEWSSIHLRPRQLAIVSMFPGIAGKQMPVGWTLTIELLLSLAMPLLCFVARRTHALVVLGIGAAALTRGPDLATFWHLWEFSLGILAYRERTRFARWVARVGTPGSLALVTLGATLWCVHLVQGWPSKRAQIVSAGLGSFLLVISASSVPAVSRPLATRPVVFLGRISYSLYLLHFPVLILLAPFFAGTPTALRAIALVATVLGVSCALSVPSHRFVEVPSIRAGNRICARIARRAHAPAAPSNLAT